MNDNILTALFIALILIIAIAIWLTFRKRRTDHLRGRFGDEYDRTVDARGNRRKAEADLEDREERVAALDIRPLTGEERSRFADEWREVKAVFVDSPTESVLHADRLLGTMMKTKGFPMADFDRRYEDLTVNHGDVARHYRDGHEIVDRHSSGNASTEDLRQAMHHYEALYDHLVSDAAPDRGASGDTDGRPADRAGHDGVTTTGIDTDGDGQADRVVTTRN